MQSAHLCNKCRELAVATMSLTLIDLKKMHGVQMPNSKGQAEPCCLQSILSSQHKVIAVAVCVVLIQAFTTCQKVAAVD